MALAMTLMCACWGAGAAQAGDDEAWIDAFMLRQTTQADATPQAGLAFGDLASLVGDPVRLELRDGRERRGTVERVEGNRATLRSKAPTGYFSYTVERSEIRRIERLGQP